MIEARRCSVDRLHELHGDRAEWTTCRPCEDHIRYSLDEVEQLWPQLPDYLERGRGHSGGRPAPSATAPLPLAEDVLSMIGPGGIHDQLGIHDAEIRTARGLPGGRVVGSSDYRMRIVVKHLRAHLAWAAANVSLKDLSRAVDYHLGVMRAVTGDGAPTGRRPVTRAACTAMYGDGTECGGTIVLDRGARRLDCVACGTEYSAQALAALQAQYA